MQNQRMQNQLTVGQVLWKDHVVQCYKFNVKEANNFFHKIVRVRLFRISQESSVWMSSYTQVVSRSWNWPEKASLWNKFPLRIEPEFLRATNASSAPSAHFWETEVYGYLKNIWIAVSVRIGRRQLRENRIRVTDNLLACIVLMYLLCRSWIWWDYN